MFFIDSQEFSSFLNVTMRMDLVKTSKDTSICKTQQTAILAYIHVIGEINEGLPSPFSSRTVRRRLRFF